LETEIRASPLKLRLGNVPSHVMKVSFSLNKPKPSGSAAATPAAAPSLKRPAAFGSADDDEPIDAAPTSSSDARNNGVAANKQLLAKNVMTSKTMKKKMEAEMKVDATVFEYDEVWDRMQEVKQRQKEAKELEAIERKVWLFFWVPSLISKFVVLLCIAKIHQRFARNCRNTET
jgi:hypothetical protein